MKVHHGKRYLNRLHYFSKWHTGVRDTGTKSRRKFQRLINSGILDLWAPINFYHSSTDLVNETIASLHSIRMYEIKEL